jgi:predicted PurR-regulated permease PerM
VPADSGTQDDDLAFMINEKLNNISAAFAILAAAVLLLAFGYSVKEILSPFLLIIALTYVLYPFREQEVVRRVLWLAGGVFVFWLLYSLAGLLAPVIVALLLAYVFNPLVNRIAQRLPRWASSLIVTIGALGVIVGVMVFVLPIAIRQLEGLIGIAGELAQNAMDWLKSGKLFDALAELGIPVDDAREFVVRELSPKLQNILGGLFSGMFGFVTGVTSLILQIINIIIIPFLFFYLSKDFPELKRALLDILPDRLHVMTESMLTTVDEILGKYLRGAILVAIIQGTISAVVLALIGVSYPLVLGIMTAVLNFIPYVGLITSLVVACIVALFSGEPVLAKVVGVIILYLSQKLLEATVLGPKIVGAKVGLHPVVLILSLLVFGYFLGFIGMLIAVPASALLIVMHKEWRAKQDTHPIPQVAEREL